MKRIVIGVLACCCLFLLSCVTEPVTGRQQLVTSSLANDIARADKAWKEICSRTPRSRYGDLSALLDKVGATLLQNGDYGHSWTFVLFSDGEPNAFSLPGGQVAINDGLFSFIDNEAELAAVVAHEMAHVIARHGAERMAHRQIVDIGRTALTTILGQADASDADFFMAAYTGFSRIGFILPYTRRHEYAADRIAMLLMAQAGYDPQCAIDFWTGMADKGSKDGSLVFLSTHPSDSSRAAALKSALPEAANIYRISRKIGQGVQLVHP